jgi:hypothetical protein
MEDNPGLSPLLWKHRLKDAGRHLLKFAKNPVEGMRFLPDWDWPFLLTCQAIAAATSGVVAGIIAGSFTRAIIGLLVVPISNALLSAAVAGFFYYTFIYVFRRPAPYSRIYVHIVFAQLPALCLNAISPLLPPLIILGPLAAGLLLLVGFVDNLGLEKKPVLKMLAGLYAVFFIFWVFNSISNKRQVESFRNQATPESLDILEKELNNR